MWGLWRVVIYSLCLFALVFLLGWNASLSNEVVMRVLANGDNSAYSQAAESLRAGARNAASLLVLPLIVAGWHFTSFKAIDRKAPYTIIFSILIVVALFLALAGWLPADPSRSTQVAAAQTVLADIAVLVMVLVGLLWMLGLSHRAKRVLREQDPQA